MKWFFPFLIILAVMNAVYPADVYQNYVQAYGEGPVGRYLNGFNSIVYTKEQAVQYAKKEVVEFLSGMIYGYRFVYKVENRLNNTVGYFDLVNIGKVKENDLNIKPIQLQEKPDELRFGTIYRLTDDQKAYIRGFQASSAVMSMGSATGSWVDIWDKRMDVFRDAMKNAVLNSAKVKLKSRPLFIKGRMLLFGNPVFAVVSGEWKVTVKVHIMTEEITYSDIY